MIAIMTMNISKERINGSKQLQLLSGTHYGTYWLSNYLHDMPIYIFNVVSLSIVLVIVNAVKNDSSNEMDAIAGNSDSMGAFFLLLLISSFTWCTWAYLWSFLFKTDIIGFVVLLILLGFLTFFEGILTFLQILLVDGKGKQTEGSALVSAIRGLLALVFPNITVF